LAWAPVPAVLDIELKKPASPAFAKNAWFAAWDVLDVVTGDFSVVDFMIAPTVCTSSHRRNLLYLPQPPSTITRSRLVTSMDVNKPLANASVPGWPKNYNVCRQRKTHPGRSAPRSTFRPGRTIYKNNNEDDWSRSVSASKSVSLMRIYIDGLRSGMRFSRYAGSRR
jgi:hypothetical protein